jgi:hypothetical protein
MIKIPSLRTHDIEKDAEIKTKGIENLYIKNTIKFPKSSPRYGHPRTHHTQNPK